mmetsp:Transcript_11784/g.23639  ORF Transcript_11784/g.23639 Transcript_11784/m.23639 type:complete len:435 (+) Transcript_11784:227-1531(+)
MCSLSQEICQLCKSSQSCNLAGGVPTLILDLQINLNSINEVFHNINMAIKASKHEPRPSFKICLIHVNLNSFNKAFHNLKTATKACKHKPCFSYKIFFMHITLLCIKEIFHHVEMSLTAGIHEGCCTIIIPVFNIHCTLLQQVPYYIHMPTITCMHQRLAPIIIFIIIQFSVAKLDKEPHHIHMTTEACMHEGCFAKLIRRVYRHPIAVHQIFHNIYMRIATCIHEGRIPVIIPVLWINCALLQQKCDNLQVTIRRRLMQWMLVTGPLIFMNNSIDNLHIQASLTGASQKIHIIFGPHLFYMACTCVSSHDRPILCRDPLGKFHQLLLSANTSSNSIIHTPRNVRKVLEIAQHFLTRSERVQQRPHMRVQLMQDILYPILRMLNRHFDDIILLLFENRVQVRVFFFTKMLFQVFSLEKPQSMQTHAGLDLLQRV